MEAAPTPTLLLAPMEGLLDFVLRDVLTRVGGVDRCVCEFIRVTGSLLPDKVFYRFIPELRNGSRTLAGVPVRAQLLGSDPSSMADNAARLAELGAEGIDLNFGCPARTVNRHGGGAAMLREPERIAAVVAAVRRAVPAHLPVSAKMRLGYDDPGSAMQCALAMQDGGACEVVVHARTKADGYRPPAYWERIAPLRQALRVPVVANGEIWNLQDAQRCRALSGGDALMLGRGMVADPGLALAIRAADAGGQGEEAPVEVRWQALAPQLARFWHLVCKDLDPPQRAGRLKQWLNLLRRRHPQAQAAFDQVRVMTDQRAITLWLQQLVAAAATADGQAPADPAA
ncbi:tRNA-dihydrouridine synthase [Pulveribacter suum]|uniref:tRNA-dihydrouridine(16) synthase n=1 Tax=Pulveribacter suum TaxID=2116657 RepID=A0A2P1NJV5_9BURK|nr:tRNA-dihydrouridine synthase [Pulveribacter suum]AVP57317.1 tRNA dihydrouridine(16) synthase DusC [Pulveribacter suum]